LLFIGACSDRPDVADAPGSSGGTAGGSASGGSASDGSASDGSASDGSASGECGIEAGVGGRTGDGGSGSARVRVIIDSDANNELDDQHAIAYALFSSDELEVEAITAHRTVLGGGVDQHLAEARRVVQLCGAAVPVFQGADGGFDSIKYAVHEPDFDGHDAVDHVLERTHASDARPLTLVAIGKLTNVALALHKDPSIIGKLRVVWLGSNWPDPGEYNLVNDEAAVSYVVESGVELAIAVVRYGAPSGTDAVRVETAQIKGIMPGLGPRVDPPVIGRNGGSFSTFGDYSVGLFSEVSTSSRALFDVGAVAIVKNPGLATARPLPAPQFLDGRWSERQDAGHSVTFFEGFDRCGIVADFYDSMRNYVVP
jgi:purine nucleosidase